MMDQVRIKVESPCDREMLGPLKAWGEMVDDSVMFVLLLAQRWSTFLVVYVQPFKATRFSFNAIAITLLFVFSNNAS